MNLEDWESPDPGFLLTPKDDSEWATAFERYMGTMNDGPLRRCIAVARANGACTVVIETRYLGPDYRSEYSSFYSRTFASTPDSAHRVHFFARALDTQQLTDIPGDAGYLGYIVIRPSDLGTVVRAMLEPPSTLRASVRTSVSETVHLFGQKLSVSGVPFSQQDTQLGACAHASAWMCHTTAALRGLVSGRPTGDFATEADSSLLADRSTPSSGLTVEQLSDLFRRFGLPPMFYLIGALPEVDLPTAPALPNPVPRDEPGTWDVRIFSTICRHLNGGFPVLVGTFDHAFILCGWFRQASDIFFIRHDDQQGPYLLVENALDDVLIHPETGYQRDYGPWRTLHVPMPGKAWLLPEAAEQIGGKFLIAASTPYARRVSTDKVEVESLEDLLSKNELTFKTYVQESNQYKSALAERGWAVDGQSVLRMARMPRWIVVVEAIDRKLRRAGLPCAVAEVVFDATSADSRPNIIAARVHGVITTYKQGRAQQGPFTTPSPAVSSGGYGSP